MAKIALIVAFQYHDIKSQQYGRNMLPGALVDAFRAYSIIKDSAFDKIDIVTDVEVTDEDLSYVNEVVQHPDVYTMLNYITVYPGKKRLLKRIQEVLHAEMGFLYYSGHSAGLNLLIPGSDTISETEIYTNLCGVPDTNQTFIVFDCCYGNNFLLPYTMEDGVFRLVNTSKNYYKQNIISICASQANQKAYSDNQGSYLTRSLANNISCSNLQDLFRRLTYDVESHTGTKPKIYASYPNITHIWPWVIKATNWIVEYDPYHGMLYCRTPTSHLSER